MKLFIWKNRYFFSIIIKNFDNAFFQFQCPTSETMWWYLEICCVLFDSRNEFPNPQNPCLDTSNIKKNLFLPISGAKTNFLKFSDFSAKKNVKYCTSSPFWARTLKSPFFKTLGHAVYAVKKPFDKNHFQSQNGTI